MAKPDPFEAQYEARKQSRKVGLTVEPAGLPPKPTGDYFLGGASATVGGKEFQSSRASEDSLSDEQKHLRESALTTMRREAYSKADAEGRYGGQPKSIHTGEPSKKLNTTMRSK